MCNTRENQMTSNAEIKLTVAMIVRDEQAVIAETIKAASPFASEIIVLDTGSSDRTREEAKECGAIVLSTPWTNDFAAARNQCLSHASGEWVMWLDAGEQLSPEDARGLQAFVESGADPACAYAMLVQTPVQPPEIAGEQIAPVRLVPNRKGVRFEGRVRESMAASLAELNMTVEGAPYRILRSNRDHQEERRCDRARRNVHLGDLHIQAQGPTPAMLNCLAEAFQHLGETANSVRFYQRSLRESETGSTAQLEAYYGLLTVLDETPGSQKDQLALCLQAVEHFPLDIQLLCAMGGYLHQQGKSELALRSYRLAYEHGQLNPQIWHLQNVYEIAATCFVAMLQLEGHSEEAGRAMQDAVARFPQYAPLRRQLLEWYISNGKRDDALALLDPATAGEPGIAAMRSAVRGACLSLAGNHVAAAPHLRTAFEAGCREGICLRNLVASLSATGDAASTIAVLRAWKEFEPANEEVSRLLESLTAQTSATGSPTATPQPPQAASESTADRTVRLDAAAGSVRISKPAPAKKDETVK